MQLIGCNTQLQPKCHTFPKLLSASSIPGTAVLCKSGVFRRMFYCGNINASTSISSIMASPQIATLSADTSSNSIQCHHCASIQEYGTGRFNKKHSTFFATMMRELGLNEEPEFYFDLVPWQSLASINHNFLLTERRRHYLRYAGGLTFFEVRCSPPPFAHPLTSPKLYVLTLL